MKIGIITQPLETNYGGLLQNYALQEVLCRLGHESITLDLPDLKIGRKRAYVNGLKGFVKRIFGKDAKYKRYISQKERKQIARNTSMFVNKYIQHTSKLKTEKEFVEAIDNLCLDALVVGSDQVWRPAYNPCITRMYFDFADNTNITRFSYAASFGVDFWEYSAEQTKACRELAKKMKAISVRERSGIELCKNNLGVEAMLVLDPTMLLDKEDYIKIVNACQIKKSQGDMFTYILDNTEQKTNIIKKVAAELNLTPFAVMPSKSRMFKKEKLEECVFPPVEQWLRAFMDAKYIICDSFHGMVFSIIFNKPFWIIENKKRGNTRFDSLLELFGLENRKIDAAEIERIDFTQPIDWEKVNSIKKEWQLKSIKYLKDNVGQIVR